MMRGISLWQPWASLMAMRLKMNETRGRHTNVRGELAIHAAQKRINPQTLSVALLALIWKHRDLFGGCPGNVTDLIREMPIGSVIAVTNLCDCEKTERFMFDVEKAMLPLRASTVTEKLCGDYTAGRFAWMCSGTKKLNVPIRESGSQGFFFLTERAETAVRLQLPHC